MLVPSQRAMGRKAISQRRQEQFTEGEKGDRSMKTRTSVSLGVWVILAISTCAFAYMKHGEEEVLQGLEAVCVKVERLKVEIEQDGLFGGTLQTDVELKLRLAGIRVLSEEQWLENPDSPYLYLFVDAFKYAEGYVYRIQISLREPVMIIRKGIKATATTLRIRDELGITADLSDVRQEAQDLVDEFIKAWQKVNRKKVEPR
jgi:hypothetical protein